MISFGGRYSLIVLKRFVQSQPTFGILRPGIVLFQMPAAESKLVKAYSTSRKYHRLYRALSGYENLRRPSNEFEGHGFSELTGFLSNCRINYAKPSFFVAGVEWLHYT